MVLLALQVSAVRPALGESPVTLARRVPSALRAQLEPRVSVAPKENAVSRAQGATLALRGNAVSLVLKVIQARRANLALLVRTR